MGYYDIRQISPFLAADGKRPVHLTYPFASHHYDSTILADLLYTDSYEQRVTVT